ncbi:casein kinase I [Dermatophagoides farinae]|uniref:non-specific serine/threonine protein kinase n=1 Tax=Dermatophagoides farinae TaxID=6954 RepID=A0A9D4P739_DERFA|nr:casein kinase I-like [Dermatophagoides farinae]KAH7646020.1 casein kinase 1 [Dermatophagoides farinae]
MATSQDTSSDSAILVNQRVGNSNFTIGFYVTGGSFGSLYIGTNNETGEKVAIKVERADIDKPQLPLEYGFYKTLGNYMIFIPKIHYFGPCKNYSALVMDLLGPSLLKMNQICGGHFGLVTTTKLMIQMLNIFEYIHSQGIIYRDVKPDNFLFGQPNTSKWATVHMIDLGFCKRYINEDNRHISYVEGKGVTGTARYISVNNHVGRELSRRDDLEAIIYMIIFLHKGQLPWQGLNVADLRERTKQIGIIKMTTTSKELCSNMPVEYENFLEIVKKIRFNERPPYRQIISQFRYVLFRMGITADDNYYDWDQSHQPRSENKRL